MIRAIETSYRGCRFRSRLEARYAVLFDALRIQWEYEPQGYVVGEPGRPYLPDFWLPSERVWVEVKGSETQLDVALTVAAANLGSGLPATGNVQNDHHVRLLILGAIGEVREVESKAQPRWTGFMIPSYAVLTVHNDDILQGTAWFTASGLQVSPEGGVIAPDGGDINWSTYRREWGNLVGGGGCLQDGGSRPDLLLADAYRSARSARFEHGESGAA